MGLALSIAAFSKNGWQYSIAYFLFENAISVVKVWAVLTGLFNLERAHEWVVVPKSDQSAHHARPSGVIRTSVPEVIFAVGILASAVWCIVSSSHTVIAIFLVLQGEHVQMRIVHGSIFPMCWLHHPSLIWWR